MLNLSVFFQQNYIQTKFISKDIWVILSKIEQSIKNKIEAVGTPLKDWDIKIYRGILTGCNEAFIISEEKRNEILSKCLSDDEKSRTEEIIRPILRGRDIKRYGYDWAGLYVIFIPWHFPLHNNPNITGASKEAEEAFKNTYNSVYNHLLEYKDKLSKRNQAETGIRYEWYALQRWGANYLEEFDKPKIIYPETTNSAKFAYDEKQMYIDKTCFMLISKYAKYIQKTLSSKLFEFAYKNIFSSIELGTGAYQYNKHALLKLPIYKIENNINIDNIDIYKLYSLNDAEIDYIENSENKN